MKTCSKCDQSKPKNDYSECSSARDGRQYKCKACCKQYCLDHKEKANQSAKQWRADNLRPKQPCVYLITCKTNGMRYVGCTNYFNDRVSNHRRRLNYGLHANYLLQQDWNKYGCDEFQFKILKKFKTLAQARANESYNIRKHYDNLYNRVKT